MLSRRNLIVGAASSVISSCPASRAIAQPSGRGWDEIYFDKHGLIVQNDGDGGDTAQREGWAWFGSWVRSEKMHDPWKVSFPISFSNTMNLLEVGNTGQFRRHPTQPEWRSDPNGFSRDQLIPLIAAMGVKGDTDRIQRSWDAIKPCFVFFRCVQGTNDLVMPDLINLYKRALNQDPEPNADALLLAGVTNRWLAQTKLKPDDVGDDLNLIIYLLMANFVKPSEASKSALFMYAKNRPVCSGCYLGQYRASYAGDFSADERTMQQRIALGISNGWKPDCPRVLGALRWYFRIETGGCPALAELYRPIIDQFMS
jgi:hypothetical protein